MTQIKSGWLAAALVAMVYPSGAAWAQESKWQAEHDAGWQAYKQGHFSEAERRLRAAEGVAQLSARTTHDLPQRSTTLRGCSVGKASPLTRSRWRSGRSRSARSRLAASIPTWARV